MCLSVYWGKATEQKRGLWCSVNATWRVSVSQAELALFASAIISWRPRREAAAKIGFNKVKRISNGEATFSEGKRFSSRDNTGHNGGAFKRADSVKRLGSKKTRTEHLTLILSRCGLSRGGVSDLKVQSQPSQR